MTTAPINAVRTLLVNFTRECLAGEVPDTLAFADDYRRVATALTREPVFLASDVTSWSESERRALFDMLAAAIVELRRAARSAPELVEGSTPRVVALGFARWLASHQGAAGQHPARRGPRAWLPTARCRAA